jgi:murein L,D-transpeptidase YafK
LTRARHLTVTSFAAVSLLLASAPADAQLARELGLIPAADPAPAFAAALPTESSFALEQLRHDRVREARIAARHNIKRLFHERGIRYPAAEVFMRIFKRERTLELWVRGVDGDSFQLLKAYDICALAGELGPKRRQGDSQTPEGFYSISFFNPRSDYHLSLHIDYPNRRDRAAGLEGTSLGGDIYIHGGCSSEGCVAITDEGIRELYWLAVEARAVGQLRIPVHIFPARLDQRDFEILQNTFSTRPDLTGFWATLKPGYDFFEEHRRLPSISVDGDGRYVVNGALPLGSPLGSPVGERAPARVRANGRAPLGSPLGTPVDQPAETDVEPAAEATEAAPPPAGGRPLGTPTAAPAPPPAANPAPAGRRPLGSPVGGGG